MVDPLFAAADITIPGKWSNVTPFEARRGSVQPAISPKIKRGEYAEVGISCQRQFFIFGQPGSVR